MQHPCTIYIVRHGESVANRDHICGSNSDLTDKGREQALETKQLLAGIHFDAVYSSDLVRAVETAEIIAGKPVPVGNSMSIFRERDFGPLEDTHESAWFALKDTYDAQYATLPFAERLQYEYGGGVEGDKALTERFMSGLQGLAVRHPDQIILVGTHAGPIRNLLMQLGFAEFLTVGSFRNAGYIELKCDGKNFEIVTVVGVEK